MDDRTAMLFCPPLPPLRLGAKLPVFIGRHPSCELAIRQDDVSRRHAEVRCEDGSFVVYDLQSTNGTFVNGTQLDAPHLLTPGDHIEVGSSTITFCEIDASATPDASADDAHTIIFERPPSAKLSFSGELSEIPTSALFQLLEMGSNSGRLELRSDDGVASVWFQMGRPVHAATEKHAGFDAAMAAVVLEHGQFRFGPCDAMPEPTIQASVTEVLLEACRVQDEVGRTAG
ncbi:MAG: FHA domain-containing protein [Deltaproteobacteria bacterium]|nr:FHA domain-containing protein [Deltaproteobacteria bacterium]MBW2382039.1 FHA domain-containing protein [Deltaproteobacteria bacterium]MBW2696910.1 FHA domain-containing protein [Deltaproteobacteria bacterium]